MKIKPSYRSALRLLTAGLWCSLFTTLSAISALFLLGLLFSTAFVYAFGTHFVWQIGAFPVSICAALLASTVASFGLFRAGTRLLSIDPSPLRYQGTAGLVGLIGTLALSAALPFWLNEQALFFAMLCAVGASLSGIVVGLFLAWQRKKFLDAAPKIQPLSFGDVKVAVSTHDRLYQHDSDGFKMSQLAKALVSITVLFVIVHSVFFNYQVFATTSAQPLNSVGQPLCERLDYLCEAHDALVRLTQSRTFAGAKQLASEAVQPLNRAAERLGAEHSQACIYAARLNQAADALAAISQFDDADKFGQGYDAVMKTYNDLLGLCGRVSIEAGFGNNGLADLSIFY